MDNKSNRLLIGIIVLLLGILSLVSNTSRGNYTFIVITVAGMAFLLLYRTKRKSWSLVAGAYLTYIGTAGMLKFLPVISSVRGIPGAMFFVVPGIIFLVLFYEKNKKGLLIPGSLLVWFGLFVMLALSGKMRGGALGGLFFICIGLAFVMMYVMGRYFVKKFTLYLGLALIVFGLIIGGGVFPVFPFGLLGGMQSLGSVAVIVVSLVIIASAFRKK